ncbi:MULTISPECIES: MazG family protein [unclassified Curtobacterium]|uniref:MazG family protein n=1 Tax=unclassified Curtobacterium TaxID=257496 RepID=UPI003827C1D0
MTAVSDLTAVVDRLLDPEDGCVWNREQTHRTLARYAVEEAYELVDAIEDDDVDGLREELGDVLYQVVLHAGIAERAGQFDLEDVAAAARDKMVRRHPHVFGDERADTVEEVVRVWRAAKAAEKSSRTSAFDGVPRAMPPLERAVKLLERLEERGDADTVVASVVGLAGGGAVHGAPYDEASDSTSDGTPGVAWGVAMLASVAAAERDGIDPVESLRAAVRLLEAEGRTATAE